MRALLALLLGSNESSSFINRSWEGRGGNLPDLMVLHLAKALAAPAEGRGARPSPCDEVGDEGTGWGPDALPSPCGTSSTSRPSLVKSQLLGITIAVITATVIVTTIAIITGGSARSWEESLTESHIKRATEVGKILPDH